MNEGPVVFMLIASVALPFLVIVVGLWWLDGLDDD